LKKPLVILLIIAPIFLLSCSEYIAVEAKFSNIDSAESDLQMHFDFIYPYSSGPSNVNRIEIYRNDSLICLLENEAPGGIAEWDFPSIPIGFAIKESIVENAIPIILKNQDISFEFSGGIKYPGFGHWQYQSKFMAETCRWLFDKHGNQNEKIAILYEPWIGRDIIKVETSRLIDVNENMFSIKYLSGKTIDFTLKYKQDPSNKFVLILDKRLSKKEEIIIEFQIDPIKYYSDTIVVPDRSNIGLVGKFNDL